MQKNWVFQAKSHSAPLLQPNRVRISVRLWQRPRKKAGGLDRHIEPIDLYGIERKANIAAIGRSSRGVRGLNPTGDDCVTGNQSVPLNHNWLIQKRLERLVGSALGYERNLQADGYKRSSWKKRRVLERGARSWNIT